MAEKSTDTHIVQNQNKESLKGVCPKKHEAVPPVFPGLFHGTKEQFVGLLVIHLGALIHSNNNVKGFNAKIILFL